MFEDFLYLLRASGLNVSLTEWMSLMEALDKGLHGSSFTGFYYLCRCLLVKSEADFDRFDRVFLEYFRENAKRKNKDGLYPTVTVRKLMWALRMKPLKKERWETVFDRRDV